MDILAGLNQKQIQAVKTKEGPVLIIAGPGSGKTRVLTHRVAYLIKEEKIRPSNILAVTFTNKAAGEMKERIRKLLSGALGKRLSLPIISTFHSFCVKILRDKITKLGYKERFTIYDEDDQLALIKQVMKDLEIDQEQFSPQTVLDTISRAKNELIDSNQYQKEAKEYFQEVVSKIYNLYQKQLEKINALDFDDLILLTVKIFEKYPRVLKTYQERFKYILVDEYQDTNHAQYRLIHQLAKKYKNLFVIGDDAQSIYQWRGADFRNILNFEKNYPRAKVIMLEENYRSSKNILEAAQAIISKNVFQKKKKLWTKNSQGKLLTFFEAEDEKEEADFIVWEIERLAEEEGLSLKDFTVLYRTNAQSRALERAFLDRAMPYKIVGGVRFYSRREIKDIMAYLKLLTNSNDQVSLERIINVPARGIGPKRKNQFKNHNLFQLKKIEDPRVDQFVKTVKNIQQASQKYPLVPLIRKLLKEINYEKYIRDQSEQGESRWENIQELFTVALKYNKQTPPQGLNSFLEETTLLSEADEVETNKEKVNLMTLHCAKGLEFEVVFMPGLEEGIFPHSRSSLDSNELEGERRLCYVGITRAKKRIYFIFTRQRHVFGTTQLNPPSRFLRDIPENIIDFQSSNDYF